MTMHNEPGSFRDPAGGVFYHQDRVCRWVSPENSRFYEELVAGNFFQGLVESGQVVDTKPLNLETDAEPKIIFGSDAAFFEHELLPYLTFASEWPCAMIHCAGLHTLELQHSLLKHGLTLKDATLYNIQFRGAKPCFLDLCSIEPASRNGVWMAYNQFCQMVLYPLMLHSLGAMDIKTVFLAHLDGISLESTVKALGFRPFFKYLFFWDYLVPALAIKLGRFRMTDITRRTVSTQREIKNSPAIQMHTVKRLKRAINRVYKTSPKSRWANYDQTCSYTDEEIQAKKKFIRAFLDKGHVKSMLDMGSNTGRFSMLAARSGCGVVAVDSDHNCVDYLFNKACEDNLNITPLCVDIANPSPGLGWFNKERASFPERFCEKFDLVLGLALVHHLVVSGRIPLPELTRLFCHYTKKYLIIEYVDVADRMFQELLKYRTESYKWWTSENFENAMVKNFNIIKMLDIQNPDRAMHRRLYIMEKR